MTLALLLSAASGQTWEQRVEAAAKEAWSYGVKNFTHWTVEPGKVEWQQDYEDRTSLVFSKADTVGTNVSCFRIPSIVQTTNGTLLAFAEARGRFNAPFFNDTCADCSALGIAVKRSFDGGRSWPEPFRWAVDPSFRAGSAGGAGAVPYRALCVSPCPAHLLLLGLDLVRFVRVEKHRHVVMVHGLALLPELAIDLAQQQLY